MYHETMFRCTAWFKEKNHLLHTRMAYSLLMVINFANSVLLTLQVFGTESALSFSIFVANTAIVLMALYGIYNLKPIFIAPNVIFKVTVSSAALFYGLQLVESSNPIPIPQIVWILISVILFVFEVHAMFSASFGILKELSRRDRAKPPPSYETVIASDASPPTYQEALTRLHQQPFSKTHSVNANTNNSQKPVVLDIESLEISQMCPRIGTLSVSPKSPQISPPSSPSSLNSTRSTRSQTNALPQIEVV
ncbi:unnamed protein product, partial [Mesorhabditis belari]|uniref:Uncharacterized protein n=1 Tax=Mesorhabditis belari TaxID=2138241 RepID=A0AAF3F089_9BILA